MPDKRNTTKEHKLYKTVLTSNIEISPGVHVITFSRNFDFYAGQVIKIAIDFEHPPRIYSICSGNKEDEIKILFNIKDDGFLTPKMAAMIPGDTILVSEPYGSFLGTKKPAYFIATGTGIAPFYSMLNSGFNKNKVLIHGVRQLNQFYFEDELEEMLEENYIRCCSRESSCNVFPGRVTDYLKTIKIQPETSFFVCGQAIMVVEVRDYLISKGVPFEKIYAEIYF